MHRWFVAATAAVILSALQVSPSIAGSPKTFDDPERVAAEISATVAKPDINAAIDNILGDLGVENKDPGFVAAFSLFKDSAPNVTDKVIDRTYGTSLRQIVYMLSYSNTFLYLRYTFKRTGARWIMTNFNFKTETEELFPKDFVTGN